ncbi:MAG TPA: cytochrome c [Gemmatimonadota bacterium]|nr:cytochrome c [Gemmatimonadota bacterium]
MPRRRRSGPAAFILAAALGTAAPGCDWFSTMSRTPAIQPHEREPIPAPEGSIPLGGLPEFDLMSADVVLVPPPEAERSPVSGRAYYETFCTVCHGSGGAGDGPLTAKFPAIPAIATPRVAAYSDAYLFALITDGRGLMPEYSRIPPRARWDIVSYMRALPPAATGEEEIP